MEVKGRKQEHRDRISISAQIPVEIAEMLNKVSSIEERSKSYYIRKGLEMILKSKLEDLEDYQEAVEAYEEFIASGEETISLSELEEELGI